LRRPEHEGKGFLPDLGRGAGLAGAGDLAEAVGDGERVEEVGGGEGAGAAGGIFGAANGEEEPGAGRQTRRKDNAPFEDYLGRGGVFSGLDGRRVVGYFPFSRNWKPCPDTWLWNRSLSGRLTLA
jgi:hypothetical protein